MNWPLRVTLHGVAFSLALVGNVAFATRAVARAPDGSGRDGRLRAAAAACLTSAEREVLRSRLDSEAARLRREGLLRAPVKGGVTPLLWPVRGSADWDDPGLHAISNFVDQDPGFPDLVLDYECGQRTYDLDSGYNHAGVDIYSAPFSWLMMDLDLAEIVAAAAGTILGKDDGNFDRSCGFNSNPWNAVYVRHDDGSEAWYGHLKSGSLTPKPVGARVEAGEYLGVMGSSGSSTGPHLHFELYDDGGQLVEPFAGACNSLNTESWWSEQPPYLDSAILRLATGFARPDFGTCPDPEQPNEADVFDPGDTVYTYGYFRDRVMGDEATHVVRRPDGSEFHQWTSVMDDPFWSDSWWYWSWNEFAPGGPLGVWSLTITYAGATERHYFSLGSPAAGAVPPTLRVERTSRPPELFLLWEGSCESGDDGFAVHEGVIGDWYSHGPLACDVRPRGLALEPGEGNRYYVVAPTNPMREGSHGRDSFGAERSPASPCRETERSGCP